MTDKAYQQCIHADCAATYALDEVIFRCPKCGNLLDVQYDWDNLPLPRKLEYFASRWDTRGRDQDAQADLSGVWRFRELLPFADTSEVVTIGEGRTLLQQADRIARQIRAKPGNLFLQYEGFNPTGSFKDNGMTAAFTLARKLGHKRVACASTGNTSAAMAAYAAAAANFDGQRPMQAIVFIGRGKIAYGKLAQALDYGALTLQIDGDFDACMRRVVECTEKLGIYLMNSVNPFRLEGQKAIMYRVLEGLDWQVPDWIIVPGGNLGNSSAFGKAFAELRALGLINRIPRIAIINAAGANTLHTLFNHQGLRFNGGRFDTNAIEAHYKQLDEQGAKAQTVASAIEIGRPVNLAKALRTLEITEGVVRQVTDEVILDFKALIGRSGYGCEPASAASLAGYKLLLDEGVIDREERAVCILTGHPLKDPNVTVHYHTGIDSEEPGSVAPTEQDAALAGSASPTGKYANRPIPIPDEFDAIRRAIESAH